MIERFGPDELERRVDEILFYAWDPIGVSPEPCARSEYDNYVPTVLRLVKDNDTVEPISAYLLEVMTEMMSLRPDKSLCDSTAKLLLEHKRALKEHLA